MNKYTSILSALATLLIIATAGAAARAADNGPNPNPITIQSLLHDMTDRDRLASWPKVEYRCIAFTSYDRASVAPDKPGWFGNRDYGQFVRIETNDTRQECVLMDADGPGAVVFLHNAAEYRGTIRIYFDNNPKSAIEAATKDLIGGKFLAEKPFSYNLPEIPLFGEESWLARNLWFPLPYAKHCKITWDGNPKGMFYYNGLYLAFAQGTKVETFTMGQLKTYTDDIIAAGKGLMTHQLPVKGTVTKAKVTIPEKTTNVIFTKSDGPGAVRRLRVSVQAEDYQQALRSTIMEISSDGEPCVWCPIGDFFGTGYDIYPHTTWYTRVDQQSGTMECLWTMPFARSLEVRLRNLGNQVVTAQADVDCGNWTWDERSMYFHATWRQATKYIGPPVDYNYVTIQGRGVYVGDSLDVFSDQLPGKTGWWGEGDEKIYVDGETFPSHFGTGTEDYYGYSWCRPNFFEMPWHALPFGRGNKCAGCSVNNRYRLLDAIPFKSALRFDMEIWLPFYRQGQGVNFAPSAFFYAFPGVVVSNPKPDPETARQPVVRTSPQFKNQEVPH